MFWTILFCALTKHMWLNPHLYNFISFPNFHPTFCNLANDTEEARNYLPAIFLGPLGGPTPSCLTIPFAIAKNKILFGTTPTNFSSSQQIGGWETHGASLRVLYRLPYTPSRRAQISKNHNVRHNPKNMTQLKSFSSVGGYSDAPILSGSNLVSPVPVIAILLIN